MQGELGFPELQSFVCFSCKFYSGIRLNSLLIKCILSIPGRDLEVKIQDLFYFHSAMMHLITNTPNEKLIYHFSVTEQHS